MNKVNLLGCLVLFIPLFSFAQGWERAIDNGNNEIVRAVDRTLDGLFITAGDQESCIIDEQPIQFFLSTFDTEASLQSFSIDNSLTANIGITRDLISLSDGNYLRIFAAEFPSDPISEYIQKVAEDGTTIWLQNLDTLLEMNFIAGMIEVSNGDYLLIGENDSSTGKFARLSPDGEVLWEFDLTSDNLVPLRPRGLYEADNGEFIITGFEDQTGIQNQFVSRVIEFGIIIWYEEYEKDDVQSGSEILELSNGDLLVLGTSKDEDSPFFTYPALQRINSQGEELWYKVYDDLGTISLTSMTESANGDGFALAGNIRESQLSTDGFLLRVDNDGNELWEKNYGRFRNDYFTKIYNTEADGFYLVGSTQNADNCYDMYLVKTDSSGNTFTNQISGTLYFDENENCDFENSENGLSGWLVQATNEIDTFLDLTNNSGYYEFRLDTGTYTINAIPISPYWEICDNNFEVSISTPFDTIQNDFGAQALIECPIMDISIGTPFLRRCFENSYTVQACNYGTIDATDARVEVLLDPDMIYLESSIPLAMQSGDTLFFDLPTIPIQECTSFTIDVQLGDETDCESIPLGATHCVNAHVFPDSICLPTDGWSGASIEVDAICQGDSIIFQIQNTGNATTEDLEYIVIEDDVILFQGSVILNAGEIEIIVISTSGATYYLGVEQESNHPGFSMPSVVVEGCGEEGAVFSPGFVNIYPMDDANTFVDIDCRENIGSFDPNDKTGFPLGYGTENFIDVGQDIEYLIRFQNTGTDTAFNIVIRDILSPNLDISSVRPGAASHPYTFDISDGNLLTFQFDDIMLPDSNVNFAASNGFVKFNVSQSANLPIGSIINNQAAIYFDFNEPIITNQTLHTIGEDYITVSIGEPAPGSLANIKVYPNPMVHSARIEIESFFVQEGAMEIYDTLGRLLHRQQFRGNSFDFKREDLQTGLYFYTITSAQKKIASGKLIVR